VTITTPHRDQQVTTTPTRRGDPVAEIEQLQDQMSQIISSFLRGPHLGAGGQQAPVWMPPADIEETDDAYVLELDLPGVHKDDVHIKLRDDEVRITGEIKQKGRTGLIRRQTRRLGQFEFMVTLPGDIDPEKVEASLHEGVLKVRLGKAAPRKPRQIEFRET